MFNNDYIMRMIEMLVQGVAKIMRLKQENRVDEAAETLTDTLRFYGLNDRSVEQLSWRDLMALASLGGIPDMEKCALLAQLIGEKADLTAMAGFEEQAVELRVKALSIYVSSVLADGGAIPQEHAAYIDGLVDKTRRYVLPVETKMQLMPYYESRGLFGRAEDALYDALGGPEGREEALEEGRAFYSRMLGKSDGELIRGGLPREEVLEGQAKLDTLFRQ